MSLSAKSFCKSRASRLHLAVAAVPPRYVGAADLIRRLPLSSHLHEWRGLIPERFSLILSWHMSAASKLLQKLQVRSKETHWVTQDLGVPRDWIYTALVHRMVARWAAPHKLISVSTEFVKHTKHKRQPWLEPLATVKWCFLTSPSKFSFLKKHSSLWAWKVSNDQTTAP